MGWLFQNEPLRAPNTPARYLTRDFTYDREHTTATVLDVRAFCTLLDAAGNESHEIRPDGASSNNVPLPKPDDAP